MRQSELSRQLEELHSESWGWALACVGHDRHLAEDVLQIAYTRILSGAAKSSGRSSFRTWAFGVIRFTALEELRRARRSAHHDVDTCSVVAIDSRPGPDVLTEEAERAALLRNALARLSPRQREVLQLVFYHDLTVEDAAAVMEISVGSARTHYDRGKKALAGLLSRLDV